MTGLNELVKVNNNEAFVCCEASPEGYPKLIQYVLISVSGAGQPNWSRWFFSREEALTAMARAVQIAKASQNEVEVK
jgi:hypothetical protein